MERCPTPQGSVLGPILFLVFINDLLENIDSSGRLFADDAKIYRRIRSPQDGESLQIDLSKLQEWSKKWLLQFNKEKCKVMHIGKRNPGYEYLMEDTPLATTSEEKDLGVIVTPDLKQAVQVGKAAASANSVVGLLKKTYTYMDAEMFLPLYKALVRPKLEYCIQAWSPYAKRDIFKLEQVQRRATKLVPELAELTYEERLKHLNLTTLEERRTRGDMIQTFKILRGQDKVGDGHFLRLARRGNRPATRGHSLKLAKIRRKTTKRSKFFNSRVVNKWNSLTEHVISSKNVNMFKNRYDQNETRNKRRGTLYEH